MLPDLSDKQAAEKVAEYFNEISNEFKPIQPFQVPTTYDKFIARLSFNDVELRLKKQKKPNSMVIGDIFPALINDCAPYLSEPLSYIYNAIIVTKVWPISWKREYVTVIPKKKMPEGLKDLRNISCTRFFSKVFESYIMENILEEITLKRNQFGGVKGCSTGHMLIEIWQDICENLEDYRCGTVLTAIDYAKAFNRLSYQHCLDAFRKKGASTPIIRLLSSFLTNRSMTVKVGDSWSTPLDICGGCPQGSILGVLLFNVTTEDLEENFENSEKRRLGLPENPVEIPQQEERESLPPNLVTSSPRDGRQAEDPGLSPVQRGFFNHDGTEVVFRRGTRNRPKPGIEEDGQVLVPLETAVGSQNLVEKPVKVYKYVDDSVTSEKLNFGTERLVDTPSGFQEKKKQALGSQNAYRSITRNAQRKDMVVNEDKTNIICISDALNYTPKTFILDNADRPIECSESIRILGFDLSNRPSVSLHLQGVMRRMRRRYWSLRHLKRLGMSTAGLIEVYSSNILPIADYCDFVYHSMMTDEQDELLENAQVGALRVVFGGGISGRKLRELAGVNTLRNRRIQHADKFASKAAADPHFSKWFPRKTTRTSGRVGAEVYKEEYARCERLRNSPIYYMRRRLNGKAGKTYGERYRIYREGH